MAEKMNAIDKMIDELCLEGVEVKELGDVGEVTKLAGYEFTEHVKYSNYGSIIALRGLNIKKGYLNLTSVKYIDESNFNKLSRSKLYVNDMLFTYVGTIGEVALIDADDKYYLAPNVARIRFINKNINPKFMLYYFQSQYFVEKQINRYLSTSSMKNLTMKNIRKFLVPIPPLAIQQEIVKILNTFTTLEEELEAKLEAELEARKKQYEYYRDELLTFGDDVEWKTLNEIGNISMCKRIFKNETLTIGDIPFYKIGTFGKQPNAFIPQELFDEYRRKYSFPKKGDVLLSASGTIGRRVIYNGEPAYFQDSNIIWIDNDETKVLNKFLYYLYEIIEWKTEGGTIQRLYNDNLKKIKIPIPPLAEQERIVAILDKFDALVNGTTPSPDGATPPGEGNFQTQKLSDGTPGTAPPGEGNFFASLPAEISLRRKQYEYYRNKLLTFNQFPSTGGVAAKG
jgi:type I restriction enzyme, S subunit